MTTEFLVLARAVHFGACLLFFGIFAFDHFIATKIFLKSNFPNSNSEIFKFWNFRVKIFSWILLPTILLSGIAWFVLVAANMSGQFPQMEILKTVWSQTQFGTLEKIRLIFWLAAALLLFFQSQNFFAPLQFFFSGALLGSLAWGGHGLEGSRWHLCADVLHLLVAGIWPTGLLPFVLLLRKLRRAKEILLIAALVRSFSALSLIAVSALVATGFVNSYFLVGSISNLFAQNYGRWLLVKIIFFCIAVAIGAINLLRLKPRLENKNFPTSNSETSAAQLQFNVMVELFLALAIIIVVAVLGILPPAAQ
jgi:putative copper resistance protein D